MIFPASRRVLEERLNKLSHGAVAGEGGTEVHPCGEWMAKFEFGASSKGEGEVKIARKRFENMLPRTGGGFVADLDGLTPFEGAETVWDNAVQCPVTTANDIAGARGGNCNRVLGAKEGSAVRGNNKFGTALGSAVRVVAAHSIDLPIAVKPFLVLVALVGGDADNDTGLGELAQGIKKVGRAERIYGEGVNGDVVGKAD